MQVMVSVRRDCDPPDARTRTVIAFQVSLRAHWINARKIPVDGLEQPRVPLDRRPF
jgi:hypothetical protein